MREDFVKYVTIMIRSARVFLKGDGLLGLRLMMVTLQKSMVLIRLNFICCYCSQACSILAGVYSTLEASMTIFFFP